MIAPKKKIDWTGSLATLGCFCFWLHFCGPLATTLCITSAFVFRQMPETMSSSAQQAQSLRRSERIRANMLKSTTDQAPPLVTIGLLADIQYAPIPDGYSMGGARRYYQHALEATRHAAEHFQNEKVDFLINLGDIADGKAQSLAQHGGEAWPEGVDAGHAVVDQVLDALAAYQHGPVIHVYGNHCLYNLDRPTMQSKLGIPFVQEACGEWVGYTSYQMGPGLRVVVIDSYDVAKLRRQRQSNKHQQAHEILLENNPNYHQNENSPEGLEGAARRFVAFNGGVGPVQLEWLRTTLEEARKHQERVLILSHQPIMPGSCIPTCLIWNYEEVLAVLREYGDVIVASLAGHDHSGGYQRDKKSGIHFRVLEAVLESPHPHKTYAILEVYDDRLEIRGFGDCRSATYKLDHQVTSPLVRQSL